MMAESWPRIRQRQLQGPTSGRAHACRSFLIDLSSCLQASLLVLPRTSLQAACCRYECLVRGAGKFPKCDPSIISTARQPAIRMRKASKEHNILCESTLAGTICTPLTTNFIDVLEIPVPRSPLPGFAEGSARTANPKRLWPDHSLAGTAGRKQKQLLTPGFGRQICKRSRSKPPTCHRIVQQRQTSVHHQLNRTTGPSPHRARVTPQQT